MANLKRENFNLRLQPYYNSLDAAVLRYLKADEINSPSVKVWQALRMVYMALACQLEGKLDGEDLRQMGLNNCNALVQHASFIRQSLLLPESPTIIVLGSGGVTGLPVSYSSSPPPSEVVEKEEILVERRSGSLF